MGFGGCVNIGQQRLADVVLSSILLCSGKHDQGSSICSLAGRGCTKWVRSVYIKEDTCNLLCSMQFVLLHVPY
jgi:hypothetical protein